MRSVCKHICAMNNAECEFEYTHEFVPTVNWAECVEEDGVGYIPLHNSLYDFNDDILMVGAEFFAEIIRLRLPQ